MARAKVNRKEVYDLLVGTHKVAGGYQFTASKIASYLGVTRKTIHVIIKKFIEKSIVVCDNPNDYIKFYSATSKPFESVFPVKKDVTQKMLPISRPSRQFALQKARYRIEIEKEYSNFFEKQYTYKRGNCTHHKYKTKIFDNCSEWTFEKAGKKALIVVVPEMVFDKKYLSQARATIFTIVYEALKWISKKAKIKLKWDTLHICQKPHVCRPARSSKAMRITRDFSLNINGKMLDMSSGKADWETTILDEGMMDAVDALDSWDVVSFYADDVNNMKNDIARLNAGFGDMQALQPKLVEKIDTMIEEMKEIREMVSKNTESKDIDPKDVAFG